MNQFSLLLANDTVGTHYVEQRVAKLQKIIVFCVLFDFVFVICK